MPVDLIRISPANALQFKAVRLTALDDSPIAFGSTYAKEATLTDADWLTRSSRWSSDTGIGYLAVDGHDSVGLVLCPLDESAPTRAHVISMWVAPTHRRRGVGRILIDAIVDWCREKNVHSLLLTVTSSNDTAIKFYRQIGFTMTGRTEPYPNDPALFEYEMRQDLVSS